MELPVQELIREVGSLLTAARPVWMVEEVEILPHGAQRVTTGTGWFYERVDLREHQGRLWLVAMGRPQPYAPSVPDGPAFLLQLINLVKQPISWDRVDESVTVTAAQEWCTQHGLPVVEAIIDEGRPGLSLGLFQRETLTLALLCSVWRAIFYEDKPTLARDLPQFLKAWASQRMGATDCWRELVLRRAALIAKGSPVEREELAKANIAELLHERLAQVNLTFAWGDSVPHLRLTAGLFDIGYLQVASLLTKPDVEITQHLKTCQNCQRLFWGHGNRRYCPRPQCRRQYVHRKKMQAQHKAASAELKPAGKAYNMPDSRIP